MQNFLWPSEDLTSARYVKQPGTVITADQALAPDNTMTADLVDMSAAAVGTGWYQLSAIVGSLGSTITRSIWLKGQVGGEVVTLQDAAYSLGIKTVTLTSTWQLYTLTSTTGATLASGLWIIKVSGNSYYAWGASMVNANWQGDYAKTTTGVINTGRPRNLVLKQNFLPYSEDMSKFTLAASTLGSKVKNPIDGAVTADVLIPNVGNAQHYCYLAVPSNPILTAGGVATYSALFKSYGWNWIRLQLAVAGGNVMAYFDIANGTVGTLIDGGQQILSADIKPFTNSYDTGWYEVSFTVKPAAGKVFGEVYFLITDTDNTNFFVGDGVKGIAVFAAQLTGVNWRGDYQPTNGSPVLNPIRNIIKKQNLLAYSNDFVNQWTNTGCSTVANSAGTLDPEGFSTAVEFKEDGALSLHRVTTTATVSIGKVYTFSVFIKKGTRTFAALQYDSGSRYGLVNLNTGETAVGQAGTSMTAKLLANDWVRVDITGALSTGGNVYIYPATGLTFADITYQGVLGDIAMYIWQAQLVQANHAGDLQKTVGTPITNPIRNIVQKQNLLLHSENAAGWTSNPAYITVTSNVEVAPNGIMTMDTITDTAVNTGHYISQTTGTITPGVFCFSAYIKPIAGCSFSIVAGGTVADGIGILVDGSTLQYISTHTTGTGFTLLDYKIQAVPNGSYKVSITFSHSKTQLLLIVATNKAKTTTWGWAYVGTGDSIGVWGMQLVQANWTGDYQVTTTAQVNNPIRNIVQTQNLAIWSDDFSNSAWAGTMSGVTATVDKLTFTTTGFTYQNIATGKPTGKSYTFSCDLKSPTKGAIGLRLSETNGVETITFKSITLTNDWVRHSWTTNYVNAGDGTSISAGFDNRIALGGDGIAGDVYVRRAQVTYGNNLGDYQPTTTAQVNNPIRNTI